MKLDEFITKII